MPLELRVLGEIDARVNGRPVDLGHQRRRCVLAVLAVHVNDPVPIDQLIDQVWGAQPPGDARSAVYAYIARLRQALAGTPDATIDRRSGGYVLNTDPTTVDMHRFRHLLADARSADDEQRARALLDEALGLWRGPAFTGLTDNPWLDTVRATLDQERVAAELDLIDLRLRQGEHTALLADLSARATAHPLNERIAGQYMLALHSGGRPAEALSHYQQIRSHLADQLGVDPGPALRELYEQLLRTDADPPAVAPRVGPPVPRQLPAHAPHFVGRTAELDQLTALLDRTLDTDQGAEAGVTLLITAIGGAGGIGKTWLALHWAHQNADRFPDGHLFVDLRGFTPTGQPMTPQTAVRGFLDGLGVDPHRIPADLDAQAALYRSLAAGKHMLIVLDNAADTTQITPLLPGSPTCTVLVTSRRYLPSLVTAHHAHPVPLDVLTDAEARHLLATRLGAGRVAAEPDAVATLLSCCAGYPLALGIVIGRALSYPDFPLSVLAAELADTTSALGALDEADAAASLPAVLSWSVQALTAEQARVFALLGIAPGPDIGLAAVAALAALPTRDARMTLRELEHASLVQQHKPGRYRMHDLIRRYATDIAQPAELRDAALRRVLDFYTHTAHTAAFHLNPHRAPIELDPPGPDVHPQPIPDVPAALAWFGTEYAALLAAQHTAAEHGWHAAVWQLAWTLHTILLRHGHHHDKLAIWQAALDAAARLPDPSLRIHAHRNLGRAYADLGRHEEGIGHLHESLALAEEHHDLDQQAHTHGILAGAWELRGGHRQALQHATRARDLLHALDQPTWEAAACNAMGWSAARLGEYDTAREHCEAARTLYRNHHEPEGEAGTLDTLGYIAHHTGQHRPAIDLYQQAVTLFRGVGNTYEAADTLDRLGHPHAALGEPDQARAVWREALRLYEDQGRDTDAGRVRRQLDTLDRP